MQLRDYLALLRRSWVLILALTILGGSVGAIVAMLSPATYQAQTQQFISVRTTGQTGDLLQGSQFAQDAVSSYVKVIPTEIVLGPVVSDLGLKMSAAELADMVTASTPLNTQLVTITVSDENPSQAAQLANAIATSFATVVTGQLEAPRGTDAVSRVRVQTVAAAKVPTAPSSPNVKLDIALGLLVGLAAGVGAAMLRQVLDTRVHTVEDVEQTVDAPILGGIPFDPDADERPLIVTASPRDAGAEAYRRLRTNVQFLHVESGVPSYVITSSAPAEGKSTAAANLALALAEAGSRVALVDADLRMPRIADLFAIEGGVGLSDVLIGRVRVSDVIQRWGTSPLFILPAGTVPPNPAELVGSRSMWRTLQEMRAALDVIIIDTPPLLAVTDAAVVARLASGAILVAASGSTRKPHLVDAARAVTGANAKLLGAVLTKLPTKGPDSYGYGQYTYGAVHA